MLKVWHHAYIQAFDMLLHEARTLAKIDHPNVVQVYEFGESPIPYLALEYLGNTTLGAFLRDVRRQHKAIPIATIIDVCCQLAGLIEYLHSSADLFQIDLKPDNLSFDRKSERIKLMDLGSVIHIGGSPLHRYGTPGYLAPELFSDAEISSASDIFSFGVLVFEMLTGQCPYVDVQRELSMGGNVGNDRMPTTACLLLSAAEGRQTKRIERVNVSMQQVDPRGAMNELNAPQSLKSLVCRMMSLNSHERPTALEVREAIEGLSRRVARTVKPSVFVSHSHKDKGRFVNKLVGTLKRRGFDVWIDEHSLRVGEPFWERIGQAISGCDFVVVVLSFESLRSSGVAEELRTAHLENLGDQVKVLPIRIDPIRFNEIPIALRARHVLDFVGYERPNVFNEKVSKLAADMRVMYRSMITGRGS